MFSRRAAVRFLAAAPAVVGSSLSLGAQEAYPAKDVRVLVPFAAGGGTDLVTRVFAQKLSEKHKRAFFVENRVGGGSSIGGVALARSVPDGYTIGVGTSSGLQTAALDPGTYNPLRDLQPVARLGSAKILLVANPKFAPNSIAELVSHVKSNPGLAFGSAGVGSANHFVGEMFAQVAGIKLTHVPYRGEGPALQDVIAGQIPIAVISLTSAKEQVRSGAIKALAITSATRSPDIPEAPTMIEVGFNDFIAEAWYGVYVPKSTPQSIVDTLTSDINELRAEPSVARRLAEQMSFDTSGRDNPEEFRKFMEVEFAKYVAIAKAAGISKH